MSHLVRSQGIFLVDCFGHLLGHSDDPLQDSVHEGDLLRNGSSDSDRNQLCYALHSECNVGREVIRLCSWADCHRQFSFDALYKDGTCSMITAADGVTRVRAACPEAYGYLLGTSALCSLLMVGD